MKGLILKDILNMRKNIKTSALILGFYFIFALMVGDGGFVSGMIVFFFAMMAITSFSYDDLAKWDMYAASLPVSRGRIVACKYIFALLLCITGSVLSMVAGAALSVFEGETFFTAEQFLIVYAMFFASVFFVSAILPLIYKFGVEKSRFMIVLIFAIPIAVLLVLDKAGISYPGEEQLSTLMALSPLLLLGIFVVSLYISSRIYKSKEF